ncbi:alpha/beta fold hydrolase [Arthrobacter sp. BB-1]|nr:alpha/beta fold hydrolase [Arthrobacter sp. BB-1]
MAGRVEIDGHPTWVDDRGGGGAPLLLLHGGLSNSDALLDTIGTGLAEHFRIVAFDRRGHGYTADTDGEFHYGDMARETVSVLENVVAGPAHLVGWSDGGIIALLGSASGNACLFDHGHQTAGYAAAVRGLRVPLHAGTSRRVKARRIQAAPKAADAATPKARGMSSKANINGRSSKVKTPMRPRNINDGPSDRFPPSALPGSRTMIAPARSIEKPRRGVPRASPNVFRGSKSMACPTTAIRPKRAAITASNWAARFIRLFCFRSARINDKAAQSVSSRARTPGRL